MASDDGHLQLRAIRMEAFSDGVFAIAITLLVLDLSVPEGPGSLLGRIGGEWPMYLAYVVSFSSVGATWLSHTLVTDTLIGATAGLLRMNLLLLMEVSFLPFPTRLVAEYIRDRQDERIAITAYGVLLLLIALTSAALWRFARHAGLIHGEDERAVQAITSKLSPSVAAYLVMIGLGLLIPIAAVFGYLAIALYIILPFGSWHHARRLPPPR